MIGSQVHSGEAVWAVKGFQLGFDPGGQKVRSTRAFHTLRMLWNRLVGENCIRDISSDRKPREPVSLTSFVRITGSWTSTDSTACSIKETVLVRVPLESGIEQYPGDSRHLVQLGSQLLVIETGALLDGSGGIRFALDLGRVCPHCVFIYRTGTIEPPWM